MNSTTTYQMVNRVGAWAIVPRSQSRASPWILTHAHGLSHPSHDPIYGRCHFYARSYSHSQGEGHRRMTIPAAGAPSDVSATVVERTERRERRGPSRREVLQHRLKQGPHLDYFVRQGSVGRFDSMNHAQRMTQLKEHLTKLLLVQQKNTHPEEEDSSREQLMVDSFARRHSYLRISLTERCNLRCKYCMPEDGVVLQDAGQLLTSEEIQRLVRLFAGLGVNKIRLTGGEPLVRKDIVELTQRIKATDGIEHVGITTNGLVLNRKLSDLLSAGLTHLNISLDTLCQEKFEQITRRRGFHKVMDSIKNAVSQNVVPVKINCVVMRGFNDNEITDFVRLTKDIEVDIRFIEWMPFDSNQWNDKTFVPYAEMLDHISKEWRDIQRLEDLPSDTAKSYKIPGFKGQFGFITSMSEHFCGSCNRLRITADGNLKVCLFGNTEVSLRDAMRFGFTDEELEIIIGAAVKNKKYALGGHQDMYGIAKSTNRPMILIGG